MTYYRTVTTRNFLLHTEN